MKVRIYVEGGGKTSWDECRLGFAELLRKALPDGPRPKVIPCGPRERAFEDFCIALREHGDDLVLLLVDAEAPVRASGRPWAHLQQIDHWSKPRAATDDSAHLMVQMMEAWFLADPAALQRFYGATKAEPERSNVETVSKRDVMATLERVTRGSRRGAYHKTRHGFALLAEIDPAKLRQRAVHFDRLCRRLATAG